MWGKGWQLTSELKEARKSDGGAQEFRIRFFDKERGPGMTLFRLGGLKESGGGRVVVLHYFKKICTNITAEGGELDDLTKRVEAGHNPRWRALGGPSGSTKNVEGACAATR